jgi:predicted MFS family arabinose efflux permease
MGIFGFGVVLAPAIGPSVGGVLVEWFGWRSIFFVVVPFCLAALWLARRYLPHSAPGGAAVNLERRRFDLPGLALLSLAILSLLNGMVHLHDANAGLGIGLLTLATLALAAFILHQRRTLHPLVRLALFRHPQFAYGGCVAFIYGAALFGSTYLVPVFMQIALGLPPSQAGAVLFPAGLVLALTIGVAGRLTDRVPVHRLVSFGLVLLASSFLLMLSVGAGTALWVIALWAVVGRIGLGFVLPSLNLGAMRGLPAGLIAHGASSINFLRQLGGAVGVSLAGIFLEWRRHAGGPGAGELAAFHQTFLLLAFITAIAVAAAWRMREPAAVAAGDAPGSQSPA